MSGKPQGWDQMPDSLLLKIMSYLGHTSVGWSCSLTCKSWHRVSKDNLLWRHLVNRDLLKQQRSPADLDPRISWMSEYERMFDRVPCQLLQAISVHIDEVIHISFSHDGKNFVACSKDMSFSVWRLQQDGTFLDVHRQDMSSFNWLQAFSSRFNPGDTRLLICGVADTNDNPQLCEGEVAVLSTGRDNDGEGFRVLFFIKDVPFDLFPCWLSDDQLISASHKIALTENRVPYSMMTLWQYLAEDPTKRSLTSPPRSQLMQLTSEQYIYPCRNLMAYSRKGVVEHGDIWNNAVNDMEDYGAEDREELDRVRDNPWRGELKKAVEGGEHCLVFFTSTHSWAPHQIGFQRITPDLLSAPCRLKHPEKVIEFGGQVIGASITPEEDTLYVNVRKWPRGVEASAEQIDELLPISEEVELLVVDLATMDVKEKKLLGHRGFTPPESAFYLYVNTSRDFVSSGSEDGLARIWDRRRGVELATLEHDDCVNCAAFSPTDQEICVTGSDDYKIKVWISRRRSREICSAACKPPTLFRRDMEYYAPK